MVAAKAAGTTFWLAPGVHTLGTGAYDHVQPKSGDTFIGAPGAVISGQHRNLYAFVGSAKHVTIQHLTIRDFGSPGDNNNEGVVNHDSAAFWTLRWSTVTANAGAGLMVGTHNVVSHNCLSNNGQYAFNVYSPSGVAYVSLVNNEVSGNNADNWEARQPGCGCTGGGKFWDTRSAQVIGNYVHDNRGVGLWADTNNRDFLFKGNYIADNDAEGILYEISYNASVLSNTFIHNGAVKGPTNPGFPTGAIYISESGSDRRVAGRFNKTFVISGNLFRDNWSGVVAWENADRFAGSPANSSSSYSTLVNPRVATIKHCGTPDLVKKKPYINDCRWKTQNLVVTRNTFSFNPKQLGSKCTSANACGFNGVFSNYGTYPGWSPYKGTLVEKHITFSQHNHGVTTVISVPGASWRSRRAMSCRGQHGGLPRPITRMQAARSTERWCAPCTDLELSWATHLRGELKRRLGDPMADLQGGCRRRRRSVEDVQYASPTNDEEVVHEFSVGAYGLGTDP